MNEGDRFHLDVSPIFCNVGHIKLNRVRNAIEMSYLLAVTLPWRVHRKESQSNFIFLHLLLRLL